MHFALEAHSVAPERIVFIGLRDVDRRRKAHDPRAWACSAFTMSDIDRLGMATRDRRGAWRSPADGPGSLHVSFDMDGIDPERSAGRRHAVRGGISYREAHLLMEAVAASGALGSLEITEINPILDRQNQTAILAVELVLSALGKTTL